MKTKTRKCKCSLCTVWNPFNKRIRKRLRGRDLKLYDEFVTKELCQSYELEMAQIYLDRFMKIAETYKDTLELISHSKRNTMDRRLARSCLSFVDALEAEKKPKESKL